MLFRVQSKKVGAQDGVISKAVAPCCQADGRQHFGRTACSAVRLFYDATTRGLRFHKMLIGAQED
jgi:hypothetical protein